METDRRLDSGKCREGFIFLITIDPIDAIEYRESLGMIPRLFSYL